MSHPLFAAEHKLAPYWLDAAPYANPPQGELPAEVDVAIVGSGYTGMVAAMVLARAGRGVAVFDAEDAGVGCSSRNGGQCGGGLKGGIENLSAEYGNPKALAMLKDAMGSLDFLSALVKDENIDCDYDYCGRFVGANTPRQYEEMARYQEISNRELCTEAYTVPKSEQHTEIGSDLYHGGGVMPHHTSLDPAKYHRGLQAKAIEAGTVIHAYTPVTNIARNGASFTVTTSRGTVKAGNVIVATNGYTNNEATFPALRRRVIPIGSYMIATEPLEPGLMDSLIPKNRVLNDTRRVVLYFRSSPDRKRIVFGGRVALAETDPIISGPRLHDIMSEIFPQVADVKISHSWMGFVAYTFDKLPHLGVQDGLHYAMGYCGSGVAMASYLGHKIGHQVLGNDEGNTAFDDIKFQTRPFYGGKPWFLATAVAWYKFLDSMGR
jgi:glycine/D-amino acid oxidase-like deaminating enzyme